jgi:translation initiation factor 5A
MADDDEFEVVDSGASLTYPMPAGSLRKGGHMVIKGRPCKIVDISTSKTGKHGHAKANIVALDVFTGRKLEDMCPSSHNIEVPNVARFEHQLVDISEDGFCSVLLDTGDMKEDLRLPGGDLGDKIRAEFDDGKEVVVSVMAAMAEEAIYAFKSSS